MPWTTADVDKHYEGATPGEKTRWVAVANAALDEYHDEGAAIRIANAAVNKARQHNG